MLQDRDGYITFHDRLGDTFRAKGHNISTAEVEHAIASHPNIESANVYAIAMNQYGYEGQLGCAALTLSSTSLTEEVETLRSLEEHLTTTAGLAGYAVPRFARIIVDVGEQDKREQLGIADRESVGTEYVSLMLKKLKTGLRKEGESFLIIVQGSAELTENQALWYHPVVRTGSTGCRKRAKDLNR